MSKDDSMEVRIAMLETNADDLVIKVAELRREIVTKAEFADLQRQIGALKADIARLETRIERLEERIARLEDRMARLEQRIESEFKQMLTKAEMRKDLLTAALGIIAVQTAFNAAMISVVVQLFR